MSSLSKRWFAIGAVLGAIGVALGAYGAHGLSHFLEQHGHAGDDLARRLGRWETAIHYQMLHAIAIVIAALAINQRPNESNALWRIAAWLFLAGILIFCGLLKVLTFADPTWNGLGRIVPLGGLAMIAGWIALAAGALRR